LKKRLMVEIFIPLRIQGRQVLALHAKRPAHHEVAPTRRQGALVLAPFA
jgi:hypothetical protein